MTGCSRDCKTKEVNARMKIVRFLILYVPHIQTLSNLLRCNLSSNTAYSSRENQLRAGARQVKDRCKSCSLSIHKSFNTLA